MNFELGGVVLVLTILAGSGGLGGYLGTRPPRSTREGNLIDQYQERYGEQVAHSETQDARIADLEGRVDRLLSRERIRDDYINVLRQHISSGQPPPPPPFPAALIQGGK